MYVELFEVGSWPARQCCKGGAGLYSARRGARQMIVIILTYYLLFKTK